MIRVTVVTLVLVFLVNFGVKAATYYSRANGSWSSTTTWSLTNGGGTAGTLPTSTDAVIINRGYTVTVDITTAVCASLQLGYTGGINTYTGTLSFSSGDQLTVSGTVTIGITSSTYSGSISMSSGGTLICQGFALNYGGTWTPGAGTVELTATNTLPTSFLTSFNNLIIKSGTTNLGVAIPTVSAALTVSAGATLALSTFNLGATTAPTSVTLYCGASGSTISGSGTLTLGGGVTVTASGTGSSGSTISCPVALGVTRTFTVAYNGTDATASDLTVSGIISGTGIGITKAGAGLMNLSGTNSYTGATSITAGTLQLGNTAALGSGAGGASVTSGAVLDLNGFTLTAAVALALNGTGLSSSPAGALTNTDVNASYSGNITLGSASTITATTSGTLTCSGTVGTGAYALTLDGATGSTGTMSGIISTPTSVIKNGAGTWILSESKFLYRCDKYHCRNTQTGGLDICTWYNCWNHNSIFWSCFGFEWLYSFDC